MRTMCKGYLCNCYEYDWGKDKCMLESEITDIEIPKFNSLQIAPEPEDGHFQIMLFYELSSSLGQIMRIIISLGIIRLQLQMKKWILSQLCVIQIEWQKKDQMQHLNTRKIYYQNALKEITDQLYLKNYVWFNEYCVLCNKVIMLNFIQFSVTYHRISYLVEHGKCNIKFIKMDGNGKSGYITVQKLAQSNDLAILILRVPQLMQLSIKSFGKKYLKKKLIVMKSMKKTDSVKLMKQTTKKVLFQLGHDGETHYPENRSQTFEIKGMLFQNNAHSSSLNLLSWNIRSMSSKLTQPSFKKPVGLDYNSTIRNYQSVSYYNIFTELITRVGNNDKGKQIDYILVQKNLDLEQKYQPLLTRMSDHRPLNIKIKIQQKNLFQIPIIKPEQIHVYLNEKTVNEIYQYLGICNKPKEFGVTYVKVI